MTTHDVLRKARAYLLEHGWVQEFIEQPGSPTCVNGAVYWSTEDDVLRDRAYCVLSDAIGTCDPSDNPDWNDDPKRTLDEVVAAFDAAIEATAPKPDESPFTALEDLPAEQYVDALSALALIPAEALK